MTTPYYTDDGIELHHGDSLKVLQGMPDGSVNSCVTSPPYFGLRDYGIEGQYGLEASPAEYVETMRVLFAEVRRVLADDGTLWLNLGDSYATGSKWGGSTGGKHAAALHGDSGIGRGRTNPGVPDKNLLMIPESVAFALRGDGWYLRNKIIWNKTNAMPESVADRLSSRYEQVLLFSKSPRYWFDLDPIREPTKTAGPPRPISGRNLTPRHIAATDNTGWKDHDVSAHPMGKNPGDVWSIPTVPFREAHFAVMPPELAERCILAGCKPAGTVLDPFSGSGTTGMVAQRHGRKYLGIDLNSEYLDMSLRTRLQQAALDFDGAA